jgi:hypothetical protein
VQPGKETAESALAGGSDKETEILSKSLSEEAEKARKLPSTSFF